MHHAVIRLPNNSKADPGVTLQIAGFREGECKCVSPT
jgi:hypothetical protein